jgi:hypothetical protein
MQRKLEILKDKIANGEFPKNFEHFGGANLIITDDKNRNHHTHDVVVFSENAGSLSWLVIELKNIYDEEIDYMNKFEFYTNIGNLMNSYLSDGHNLEETMLFVVNNLK